VSSASGLTLEHCVMEELGVKLVGDGLHLVARGTPRCGTAALTTVAGVTPRDIGLAARRAELLLTFSSLSAAMYASVEPLTGCLTLGCTAYEAYLAISLRTRPAYQS